MHHLTRRNAVLLLASLAAATPALARSVDGDFFDSAGIRIHYVEDGRGEPVVLLHGYTSNIEAQWINTGVFQMLARKYRVIALDARGHGLSGKPHDRAAYGPEMGMDIVRLLDHLGLPCAHIVGYSMGAHIVAQLLTRHPERFITATLGGASGRRNWSVADQRRVDAESTEMEEGMLRSQMQRLWPRDRQPPSDDEVRASSARQLAGQDAEALAAVRRSNPDQVVTEAQMRAVQVPTLGIVGTNDPYLREFQQLKAAMPQLQLVTIAGASHGTAPERAEFVQALETFLADNPSVRQRQGDYAGQGRPVGAH